jgi:hypothetical protein
MKTKKAKLTLKKSTIANLNDLKLADIRGGVLTELPCHSEINTKCPEECPETDQTLFIVCPGPITYYNTCWCVTEPPEYSCVTECPYVTCINNCH